MALTDHSPGLGWRAAYHWLRVKPVGSLVLWEDYKAFTGQDPKKSRAWITRAAQEMRTQDGLTIGGQCKEGFYVVAV